jgi:hypothetical protein
VFFAEPLKRGDTFDVTNQVALSQFAIQDDISVDEKCSQDR